MGSNAVRLRPLRPHDASKKMTEITKMAIDKENTVL